MNADPRWRHEVRFGSRGTRPSRCHCGRSTADISDLVGASPSVLLDTSRHVAESARIRAVWCELPGRSGRPNSVRSRRSGRLNRHPLRERYDPMTRSARVGFGSRLLAGSDLVHGRPVRTYGRGRTCMVEGCDIHLSLYNPNAQCSLHDHDKY